MPDQLQLRGGTTAEHSTFTGASKEVTVDTTKKTAVVHDGTTAGGIPLLRQDGSNSALALGSQGTPSLKWDANTGIYSPGEDQLAVATNGTGRLFVDASGNITTDTNITSSKVSLVNSATVSTYDRILGLRSHALSNAFLGLGNDSFYIAAATSAPMIFCTNSDGGVSGTSVPTNERLRIRSDGMFEVKGAGTAGSSPAFSVNGSAPANSAIIDASGRLLVGTSTSIAVLGVDSAIQVVGTGVDAFSSILRFSATAADCGGLLIGRSKSATKGTNTAVVQNDALGEINFAGATGTTYHGAASISAFVDGEVGTGNDTTDMPGRLVFSTTADGEASPTERMRLGNSGNAEFFVSNGALTVRASGGSTSTINALSITSGATGTTDGTLRFVVETRGNVFNQNNAYGSLSDVKLKENIVDASSQWSDLKNLKVRKYNFKEIPGHTQIGLVAQEAELVSPGLVSESPDRDEEGNDLGTVTKSVSYSVLYMKAVKALQEAMERIEQLESKVAALEGA
jgi:hypothetical protein